MASLLKQLRIHQIFGANTDVGKTILTSALVRSSASSGKTVFYLKPVSTGPIEDADDEHVKRHAGSGKGRVHTGCLYRYDEPVSPHLAARLATDNDVSKIPSQETFVDSIAHHIRQCSARVTGPSHMYVETAGGVHSPTLSGITQLDSYRPLFLPTILIGDSKLGGISSTISAYESLLLRGFIVDSIILFRDEYYRNWEFLQPYFAERGVHVSAIDPPPPRVGSPAEIFASTETYYDSIASDENDISVVQKHLDSCHVSRIEELESMPRRTLDSIWWPFVQHGLAQKEEDVNVIDSAYSDFFSISTHAHQSTDPSTSLLQPQFDGSASWWTQTLGHAHPSLTMAAARASGRYGHVMFPKATHLPALRLAERLLQEGPGKGWASRAFFSDDGSTGMEIAIKMALRAFSMRHGDELSNSDKKSLGVLGLKGSYHGDTIGAMDACEEGVYTCEWHDSKGYWLDPPTVAFQEGKVTITIPPAMASETIPLGLVYGDSISWVYDIPKRIDSPLAGIYRDFIQRTLQNLDAKGGPKLAALVLEPLVMGAGGMLFVDPLFQRVLIDVVRASEPAGSAQWSGMPIIFDEVFVGLYRIGMQSTGPLLGVNPDISVNAKILTGGLVPLAVTLASDSIFQAFWSDKKVEALLHGHSYTAHPIGCEVANETLKIIDNLASSEQWIEAHKRWEAPDGERSTVWSLWDPSFVEALSKTPMVSEVMTLGSVLAIKMRGDDAGYSSQSAEFLLRSLTENQSNDFAPSGAGFSIHFRTLGDVAYFITSLNTPDSTIRTLEDRIWQALR